MAAGPSPNGGLDIAAWRAQIEAMKAAVAGLPPSASEHGGSTTGISDWEDDEIDSSTYSPTSRNGDGPRDIWDFISDDELDSLEFGDAGGDHYHDYETDGAEEGFAGASGSGSGSGYDFGWLASRCADVRSAAGLGAGALQDQIMEILGSGKSEDELQSSLTDLIGFDDLDFVIDLISHREELVSSVGRALKQQQQGQQGGDSGGPDGLRLLTKAQRQAALQQRDLEHKSAPLAAARSKEEEYPHVYRAYSAGNTLSHSGKRYALPPGSERKEFEKYEEYTIPAGKTGTLGAGRKLVNIADMDGLCRNTFRGYKTLNRMQSLVYPVAYKTSENMLICAPTGAVSFSLSSLFSLEELRSDGLLTF